MSISDLIGGELVNKALETVRTSDALKDKSVIGLYFSAHWCPPCRGFTPELVKFYQQHAVSKKFEIVFVSSDQSEEQFKEYYSSMPWLALPFQHRELKNRVSEAFSVRGIPTLVFLDASTGDILCLEGREKVGTDPSASAFPWA